MAKEKDNTKPEATDEIKNIVKITDAGPCKKKIGPRKEGCHGFFVQATDAVLGEFLPRWQAGPKVPQDNQRESCEGQGQTDRIRA